MKLLGKRIEIEPLKPVETVGDSIKMEVPVSSQEENNVGTVGLVGSDVEIPVKEGDVVVYTKYAVMELAINGENILIVDESDIVLILDK